MSRLKTINYRRVTFSFPADLLDSLRLHVDKNNMSAYVVEAVKKKLSVRERLAAESKDFIKSLEEMAIGNTLAVKDKRSSLEILREIRYGGKY